MTYIENIFLCLALPMLLSLLFTVFAAVQPQLTQYLPIGIIFLAVLVASVVFLFPSGKQANTKA